MKLYVDADACPTVVKDIIIRAALRLELETVFIANQPVSLKKSQLISMIVVEDGPDIADDRIVEMAEPGDLIVTEDIPLADRIISKNAFVISTRGELYTKENIKQRLSTRDLLNELRNSGIDTGGPSPYTQKDTRMFANQLDRFLTRNC